MVKFLLVLFVLFLAIRLAARLLARLFRIQGVFSFSGPGRERRPVSREERRVEEADYEVLESHIRDDSRES